MILSDIGEFGIIKRITNQIGSLPNGIEGIGDDCAVIPLTAEASLVVTTDLLIEDTHFLKENILPEDLGYKSLAVNLSDIAAMGALPLYAFLSLGLPKDTQVDWLDDFFKGFFELARKYNVLLLGGDTTRSTDRIVINVAVMGKAKTRHVKFRSTAQPGDIVCVTGFIGDSLAGLKLLLNKVDHPNDEERFLIRRHYRPEPHLRQGEFLSTFDSVHAMMDLSDGLDSDLGRIMEASKCGFDIQMDLLPTSTELRQVSSRLGWAAKDIAAIGGEDYSLVVTIEPDEFESTNKNFIEKFKSPLFRIGEVTDSIGNLEYFKEGRRTKPSDTGFRHFSNDGR